MALVHRSYALMVLFFLLLLMMVRPFSEAQSMETPFSYSQVLMMGNAIKMDTGDILIDNFEYFDSPLNHGWYQEDPSYPVYGFGIGYGLIQGVLDFEEGSQVLNVYKPSSVFLPFNSSYMPYTITKSAWYSEGNDQKWIGPDNSELSFKVRAPLAIETFDTFSFEVIGSTNTKYTSGQDTGEDHIFHLILMPRDNPKGGLVGIESLKPDSIDLEDDSTISLYIGKQYQDGTWHSVNLNLAEVILRVTGESLKEIRSLQVRGNQYRLDDIIFFRSSPYENHVPYLFRIGPVYAQLFDVTGQYSTRFIFAEDPDLGSWYLDPNGHPLCYVDYGKDLDVPPTNSNLRFAPVVYYRDAEGKKRFLDGTRGDPLLFKMKVGGSGVQGVSAPNLWTRIPLRNPTTDAAFDPPLIPYLPKMGVPPTQWLQGDHLQMMEEALLNSGFEYWPNVIALQLFNRQVFENLIVTCEVTDGKLSDTETFPLSVINYPVTNNPPRIEDLNDQCFEVGRFPNQQDVIMGGFRSDKKITNAYTITAIDPDMGDALTYSATLNGVPSYQYGPWMDKIINPFTGVISFTPQFEGTYQCTVTVRDLRGLSAFGSFSIFCVNKGTWFNHSPIIVKEIESPQLCRAGELFTLSELHIFDPDDENLFYSCNFGSVSDNGVFSIQSKFPGEYLVQITGYDRLGGSATQEFMLKVNPFWSL